MTTLGRRPMANGVEIQTQNRGTASECDNLLMRQMGFSYELVLVVLVVVVVKSECRLLGKNLPAEKRHRLFCKWRVFSFVGKAVGLGRVPGAGVLVNGTW